MSGRSSRPIHRTPSRPLALKFRSRKRQRTSLALSRSRAPDDDTLDTGSERENPLEHGTRSHDTTTGPSRLARRSSLPRRQSPPLQRSQDRSSTSTTRERPGNRNVSNGRKAKDGSITQPSSRSTRLPILSSLPVNHAVARSRFTHQSYSPKAMQPKRAREISNGGRKARSALVFVDDGEMTRGKKRKRPLEVDATAHSSEEEVEDDEEEEEDQEEDIEMNEDSDEFHLLEAPANVLRRLLRAKLARLYSLATSEPFSTTTSLTKGPLIDGILEARTTESAGESTVEEEEEEEDDDEEGDEGDADLSRPSTSHEASPAVLRTRVKNGGKKRGEPRIRHQLQHVPTPPPSSIASSASLESHSEGDDVIAASLTSKSRTGKGRSASLSNVVVAVPMQRRSSNEAGSSRLRKVSNSVAEVEMESKGHRLRNGKVAVVTAPSRKGKEKVTRSSTSGEVDGEELDDEFEEEDGGEPEEGAGPTPVAHRTRHAGLPRSPIRSPGNSRPSRQAKSKAVARIERGTRSKADQTDTPPSDADEESGADDLIDQASGDEGGDEEEEADMSIEIVSHQRAPRKLRNGKVVELEADEDEDMDVGDDDMECEDEETVMEVVEDEVEGQEDELADATSKSLLRFTRDDLVRLCEERELDGEGTKKELVTALLEWRDQDFDHSSGESSNGSTASAASNATARARVGKKAFHDIRIDSSASIDTPLLMRSGHSRSPEKPQTPAHSKHDEQEEVNALDLESLHLQDKEIAPEKLTKLEKIGSGGFKDVYKGLYGRKTIAIADIRGHLTEMDIKELSLLRDLRHPNIVHFIGVSIPKEPSFVPVMIVTELCANGDLFDYIRGVDHPPFLSMLEIMLGIAKGVNYLHSRIPTVIHRDIKSSNVLITAQGVAKIGDFGLARVVETTMKSMIRSLVGTVNWQAPELWVPHPRYNEKVDVYSVGLVLWEVCQWSAAVKRYPFEGMNDHAIFDSAGVKKQRPSLISARRTYGTQIADLIDAMWNGDPKERPSMYQVVLEIEVMITSEKAKLPPKDRRHPLHA